VKPKFSVQRHRRVVRQRDASESDMHRLVHKRLDQRGVQQAAEPVTVVFLVQRDAELDRFTASPA
jgi:hypothetical protein